MTERRYRRVTRRRPCPICGKPDWCSRTPDDRISFCARVNSGADRISKEGWGVFYRTEVIAAAPRRYQKSVARKPLHLAPIDVRDFVYRKLLELSPAQSSVEILGSPSGLYSRKIFDAADYGSLPRRAVDRDKLAARLSAAKILGFADAQEYFTQGIPGFWSDHRGKVRLGSEYDFGTALLLIPVLDRNGLIQACQLRLMGEFPNGCSRYFWLSSAGKRGGSSPGSPLHYSVFKNRTPRPLLVTEGPLKAQTAKSFFPDHDIVASSGVSCSHTEIVLAARYRPIEIAFDSDSFENPHVACALGKLICLRMADQKIHSYNNHLSVLTWNQSVKGLDEALIRGIPIKALPATAWFMMLTPECQSAVMSSLAKVPFVNRNQMESHPQQGKQMSGGRKREITQSKHRRHERLKAGIA